MGNAGLTTATGISPLLAGILADRTSPTQAVGWFGLIGTVAALALAVTWVSSSVDTGRAFADDEGEGGL
jgi:hypothetical protein